MSGLGIVFYREREEGRTGRGSEFPNWFIIVRIEASPFSRCKGGVLNPELEFAVGSYRGYEIGMDGWWQPLNLLHELGK